MSDDHKIYLPVTVNHDGHWICFAGKSGRSAAINIEALAAKSGPITGAAILEWCSDQRHIHVAGTTIGNHIDECAVCGKDIRHPIHAGASQ